MDVTNVPRKLIILGLFILTACVPPQVAKPPTTPPQPTVIVEPTATSELTIAARPGPAATPTIMPELSEQIYETIQRLITLNKQGALNSADAKKLFSGELADWDAPMLGVIQCLDNPDLLAEIAEGLESKNAALVDDCAEVLTQVAEQHPDGVAPYAQALGVGW